MRRLDDDPKDQQAEAEEPSDDEEALTGDKIEVTRNDLGDEETETK
jgi:hypothetical protein